MPTYQSRRANRRRPQRKRKAPAQIGTMQAVTHLAKKAWSGFNQIRGLLNTEKKFIEFSANGSAATAGLSILLSGVANGDTNLQREGNQIRYKYANIKYQINTNTISTVNRLVRVMLYMDTQNNSSLPATTDLLESASIISQTNKFNTKRFKILHDVVHNVPPVAQGGALFAESIYIPLSERAKYDGTDALIGSCRENQIFFFIASDSDTVAPTYSIDSRMRFIDN